MNESLTPPGSEDELFLRFMTGLEATEDRNGYIDAFCREHPEREAELRDMARAWGALRAAGNSSADTVPKRLGDFINLRWWADGGMGVVYEAVQKPFGRRVAVKTIRSRNGSIPDHLQDRFSREQEVLAKLHHTHIVPIHAAGRDEALGLQYYAMEFIDGAPLSRLIQAARSLGATSSNGYTPTLAELALRATSTTEPAPSERLNPGEPTSSTGPFVPAANAAKPPDDLLPRPLPPFSTKYLRSVAKVMADAADALQHAHEAGVLHRDLKPSNIMVDKHEHCWVVDFGLARLRPGDDGERDGSPSGEEEPMRATLTHGTQPGTPRFMAPEAIRGEVDPRTDVWGLGVTLYELLTLRPAFPDPKEITTADPPHPRHLVTSLPPDLDAICRKALRKSPSDRYPTAAEFRDDLRRWLNHEPTKARPARLVRRAFLWSRRNKGWAVAIATVIVGLLGLGTGGLALAALAQRREREQQRESLIQQIQRLRLTTHTAGWSDQVWGLARQAAGLDRDQEGRLQSQAEATLAGLDARTIKRFPVPASALAFDPSGRLLMGGVDGRVRIWKDDAEPIQAFDPAGRGPFAVRPDGTTLQLVFSEADRSLVLREVEAVRILRKFALPVEGIVESMAGAMTPDGTCVVGAAKSRDGKGVVIAWETGLDQPVRMFDVTRPTDVALTPDGKLLAAGDEEGRIIVWSLPDGEPVANLAADRNSIHCLAFGPDPLQRGQPGPPGSGWLLAVGDAGGTVTVWDLHRKVPRSLAYGSAYDVYAVAFSPDGMTLASAGREEVKLWDLATGRLLLDLKGGSYLVALAFSPDGRRLAVGMLEIWKSEIGVFVWELENGRGIQALRGLHGRVEKAIFSPDGSWVAALAQNWRVGIWDRRNGRLVRLLDVSPGFFTDSSGLAFSDDGRRFAFAAGRETRLWDVETGAVQGAWPLPGGLNDQVVFRGSDQLWLFRQETKDGRGDPLAGFAPRDYPRVCVVRNLLGPTCAEPLAVIGDFNSHIHGLAVSPDAAYLVVEGIRGTGEDLIRSIRLYEATTGKPLWTIPTAKEPDGYNSALQFDPTGRVLFVNNTEPNHGMLLDPARLQEIGRPATAMPFPFGPGARRWLTSSHAAYTLHERGRPEPLITFLADSGGLDNAQFSPNGRYLVGTSRDGTVFVRDLEEIPKRLAELGLGW